MIRPHVPVQYTWLGWLRVTTHGGDTYPSIYSTVVYMGMGETIQRLGGAMEHSTVLYIQRPKRCQSFIISSAVVQSFGHVHNDLVHMAP